MKHRARKNSRKSREKKGPTSARRTEQQHASQACTVKEKAVKARILRQIKHGASL